MKINKPVNTFRFRIVQDGEKKRMQMFSPAYFSHWIAKNTKVGDEGTVDVKIAKPTRSEGQLAFYWVILGLIAEHTGYVAEDVHEVLMQNRWGLKKVTIAGKVGWVRRSVSDKAKFPKSDMVEQISDALGLAYALDVRVPTKEELGYHDTDKTMHTLATAKRETKYPEFNAAPKF